MEVSPEVRRLIHRGAATHELRDQLKKLGFSTLRDEGVALALEGKTSPDEVLRVTHNEDETLHAHPRKDNAEKGAA
jgi:type II secretory ATPase GspE/PulE/Tfp pilus assembly ATPase PilB-like protein